MNEEFKAETGTMESAAAHVKEVSDGIDGLQRGLQQRLTAVEGAWGGTARKTFDGLIASWDDSARRLNQSLVAISENIRTNGNTFTEAQDAHVAALNNAGASLDI
ncbi:WXG100 family type VII secretion target [Rhodococcus sp. Q]|uniref:WXG100 family type VII secretion target n=1 Tax=Rhodococcus sp. Q TaxID=2502252 RepID=UPI0010F53D15|nr:WXG100 family type VII secretion target [Rhodococcus sp. Q]